MISGGLKPSQNKNNNIPDAGMMVPVLGFRLCLKHRWVQLALQACTPAGQAHLAALLSRLCLSGPACLCIFLFVWRLLVP